MEQPNSDNVTKRSRGDMRTKAAVALIVIFCILAVIATVGSLGPGTSKVPTPAAADMKVGELLFADDCVDDRNDWLSDIDTEAYFDRGELHLFCHTPGGSKPKWFFTTSVVDNLAFQVQARKISGPDQQYGLIFGETNGGFYLFGVTDYGYYGLMRWTGEEWIPIVDYTSSANVKQAGGPNTLTVFCKDSRVELHANGEFLEAVVLAHDIGNAIGLYAATDNLHVAFDDVRVYSLR